MLRGVMGQAMRSSVSQPTRGSRSGAKGNGRRLEATLKPRFGEAASELLRSQTALTARADLVVVGGAR